jgi:hypothetical protein
VSRQDICGVRHCEERSDEAIQCESSGCRSAGPDRFAFGRNDGRVRVELDWSGDLWRRLDGRCRDQGHLARVNEWVQAHLRIRAICQSMIAKSGCRFSEKIMLNQRAGDDDPNIASSCARPAGE